ncbi:MAG: NADH dehydrogenase [Spirochaetes bacterium GWD1_27_9]|nr:MAG: NADH dehydrogenase [Spirochaetes bacterium GWB1_27_13]OHD22724.1 MAG: NADH dehydrogenase [Spirochaetes bacterium GWC1_27_15]OHD28823.1 MAG: NADH dehydrogenase [Spirochaetes bacterium GWD1_27_9]
MIEIKIGTATCGNAAGAQKTLEKFQILSKENNNILISETGCIGMCYQEPIVEIFASGKKFLYANVDEKVAEKIFTDHVVHNNPVPENLIAETENEYQFNKQKRIVLRNTGIINPEKLEEYIARGGYEGLKKSLAMTPADVVKVVTDSGLRGRGGAGFSTGMKWKFASDSKNDKKYVICNADEGDPGAFMDRSVLEGDPHAVIEGILICGYAIGANEGYVYCRAEYPLAIKRLLEAIKQAEEKNLLGKNILGTNFSFELHIKEGAGAFVCGEETALMASIEGKRGMPRLRPPFPAVSGLWAKPTNINNVETLACVSYILANGAESFNKYGTEKSKGTKVFALAGKIKNGGLVEVPMGISLKEVIFEIGGGIKDNKKFKAVQMGGPSGGCIPESLINTPVDYESLMATGAIVGSGGMVVVDEDTCMVDVARYFLNFTQTESCGKCTFCRIGTKRMLEILTRICDGKGEDSDVEKLLDLANKVKNASLCGLGQTAPNPILTTLKYFKDEYIAHIRDKKCPAGVCTALIRFDINDKCIGCGACKRACPVAAITGTVKQKHILVQDLCIKCGSCYNVCKFSAVDKG